MFLTFHPLADKANNEHLQNHSSRSYENRSKTLNNCNNTKIDFVIDVLKIRVGPELVKLTHVKLKVENVEINLMIWF